MTRWKALLRWLDRTPKRDPEVDRTMEAVRTTRHRRAREHDRLDKSLSVRIERDLSRRNRDGFAD